MQSILVVSNHITLALAKVYEHKTNIETFSNQNTIDRCGRTFIFFYFNTSISSCRHSTFSFSFHFQKVPPTDFICARPDKQENYLPTN